MDLAYSYMRFSSPAQAKGDSIRRQTANRDAWLQDNSDVKLDTSLKMTDAGRSGFKRHNPDTYALHNFLELVKAGKVKEGSYLLVENLDRLTREETVRAVNLFSGILLAGIRIVQLDPLTVYTQQSDAMDIMRAVLEMSRGHSESARKSATIGKTWAKSKSRRDKKLCPADCPDGCTRSVAKERNSNTSPRVR